MAKYVYPAVFTPEDVGGYSVEFPDIPGCYTQGEDLADALEMAKDALELMLYGFEDESKPIPPASKITEVKTEGESFTSLVEADTLEYQKMFRDKAVRKNVSIPGWLAYIADKKDVNLSSVLQKGLKDELNIAE